MNWFVLSLLAGLCFAVSRTVARFMLRKQGHPLAFTAVFDFIAGAALLPFIFGMTLPNQAAAWVSFGGVVVFAFLSDWLAFIALKTVEVSEYQILNQVRHIVILFGGWLFFNEAITSPKVVAVLLIIIGIGIAMYERRRLVMNHGALVTILSTLAAVVAFLFAKQAVQYWDGLPLASLELIIIGLISFGLLGFRFGLIRQEIKTQRWGLVFSGLVFGGFEGALFLALNSGEASRVVPATQSSLVFTLIMGFLFLKERSRFTQKVLGVAITVVGIIFLYVW